MDITKLVSERLKARQVDTSLAPEMRSNMQLKAGNHYTKKFTDQLDRLRNKGVISRDQKVRLTKNHIARICNIYIDNIIALSPGVSISAFNEDEPQDQKSAELNDAVWKDIKDRHEFDDFIERLVDDYVTIGEFAVKIGWDETAGEVIGEKEIYNDDEMLIGMEPVYSGDFLYERIFCFDLWRDPTAQEFNKARFVGYDKMVFTDDLKDQYREYADKIQSTSKDGLNIFDPNTMEYTTAENMTQVSEMYIRPNRKNPKGYFYIFTSSVILAEGELPFGIFPIVHRGWDNIQTSPRYHSIIKQLRPYQYEINRAGSKIVEHHLTLGDDKMLMLKGTKVSHGISQSGIREIYYSGREPIIQPGRSGDQFVAYVQEQIQEMYQVANLQEEFNDREVGQIDAYALMFKSAKQKKKYSKYASRFERALIEIAKKSLEIAKQAYTQQDNRLIRIVGKNEIVNIDEFKSTEPLSYSIKIEEQGDDIESRLGKQFVFQNMLQYVGGSLNQNQIGGLLRQLPFLNTEELINDFTINYDNANNDILALDRGEAPVVNQYDEHEYYIQKLINRMKRPSFKQLHPQIQANYQDKLQQHQQAKQQQDQQIENAKNGNIPMGDVYATINVTLPDPETGKLKKLRLPVTSIEWLAKRLQEQGIAADQRERLPRQAQADMAGQTQPTTDGGSLAQEDDGQLQKLNIEPKP